MIGSNLVDYIYPANSYNNSRFGNTIKSITIHHMAGILTAKQCVDYWNNNNRETSSHYGIGKDGKIGQYVSENHTAWTNGNRTSNRTSITIETSNSTMAPDWKVSDKVLESLITLIHDVAVRNNLLPLIKGKSLTWHSMVSDVFTECPGPYLTSKIDYIIERVNSMNEPFKVGTTVYNKEDVILYGTAGYDTKTQFVLPKNSESKVFKYHSVNGLYMALKDMSDELYPGAWTKEFDKFTLNKPVEEPPIVIPPIKEPTDDYVLLKEVFEAPETRVFRIKLTKGTKLYIKKK
jgi:hypothetical protein